MDSRAAAARQTREKILQAAYDLWLTEEYDEVSLERVAARAQVTKQTVIRRFGSKERLACAVVDWQRPIEEAGRVVEPGSLSAAIDVLLARYEHMGDANVRVLALERRVPEIRYLLEQGRDSHRRWVERVFAPFLPRQKGAGRRRRVMAFYAATEVTLWKLLRRDFGMSRSDTRAVLLALVSGLTARKGAS
jgi:AcrR family transcriptional regulator